MAPYSSISKLFFTFTIGLPFIFLLISILQVDAVRAFVNQQGPKPQIWFVVEPPNVVVAAPVKNKPVYLQCHATVELEKNDLRNLQCGDSSSSFDFSDNPDRLAAEDDYEEEVKGYDPAREQRIKDGYLQQQQRTYQDGLLPQIRTHFTDLKADGDAIQHLTHSFGHAADSVDNFDEEEDDNEGEDLGMFGSRGRHRRNVNRAQDLPKLEYVWYRNGEPLLTTSDSTLTLNGFRLSPNGTLRIQYSNLTSGVYRCMVNETRCGIGAVLSKNVLVKVAMLERDSISNNSHIVAMRGGSIVLNCPFKSYPAAKFSWYFNKLNDATMTTTPLTTATAADTTVATTTSVRLVSSASFTPSTKDNRYFLLSNGSLLITSLTLNDTGRYKCEAHNEYIPKKSQRVAWTVLKVEEPSDPTVITFGLMPSLQSRNLTVTTHDTLRLHCGSYSEKISWSFTPKGSDIPIQLTDFTNELKYVNASIDKHEGIYNCSTPSGDYQLFNVTVTSPPALLEPLDSFTTSVAAQITFVCNATGNPPPNVTWYRNGKRLENNYVTSIDGKSLKINCVEPEDQGIYECFARNPYGEVKSSTHLTVRKKQQYKDLSARPLNVKCYPADFNSVIITYESKDVYNTINYYIATRDPYTWQSPPPLDPMTKSSFRITTYMEPLRKYGIYLRGTIRKDAKTSGSKNDYAVMTLTRMSDLVECATQGIPVRYTSMTNMNSIFIWWADTLKLNLTSMVIQFLHNDTMDQPTFKHEIIGTYANFGGSNNYLTYSEFGPSLEKIPIESDEKVRRKRFLWNNDDEHESDLYMKISRLATRNAIYPNSNEGTISEVKVFGNVTGILIPNSQRIIVRVLGSTEPDGSLFPQDLKFVPWTTVELEEATLKVKLWIVEKQARNMRVEWSPMEEGTEIMNSCMEICYKDTKPGFLQRGGRTMNCRKINPSVTEEYVDKLTPLTPYKVFIRGCNNTQPLSEVMDVTTEQDVPGIIQHQNVTKMEDGIVLYWEPPTHPNGALLYYLVEWTKDGDDFASNISINGPLEFKFPNTSATDKFNMSIRAVSKAGKGNPILIDLRKHNIFEFPYDFTTDDSIKGIALGIFLSIFCIIICIYIFVRNRNCNKTPQNNQTTNNNHGSPPGSGIGAGGAASLGQNQLSCTADIHEMQTLIASHDISTIVANGTVQHYTRPDVTEVCENVRTLHNAEKILKQSPKLSIRREDGDSYELEPLRATTNGDTPKLTTFTPNGNVSNGNGIKPNGIVTNGYSPVSAPIVVKTNGSLRITENPQYSKPSNDVISTNGEAFLPSSPNNSSSIFDSSQQKLLDDSITSTNSFSNRRNNNNSNSSLNNRDVMIKIDDKLSTSTLKNFQQQHDDLSYDLNTSNLSTKPLTGPAIGSSNTNGWLYRQPIVGPNG
ncbi:uncharacterized protein LOC134833940 [Culicoides brevitarsis]|uniref:uncharacterized protein LOC134833940 n=1 Tax=Culicoides brevitarsis TaxID=469753 RepID=UPI00307B94F2